jgi:hypothetical protein
MTFLQFKIETTADNRSRRRRTDGSQGIRNQFSRTHPWLDARSCTVGRRHALAWLKGSSSSCSSCSKSHGNNDAAVGKPCRSFQWQWSCQAVQQHGDKNMLVLFPVAICLKEIDSIIFIYFEQKRLTVVLVLVEMVWALSSSTIGNHYHDTLWIITSSDR